MAGQKRSLITEDSDLSRHQAPDDEITPELWLASGLPTTLISTVSELASLQGLSLPSFLQALILKHLEELKSDSSGNLNFLESKDFIRATESYQSHLCQSRFNRSQYLFKKTLFNRETADVLDPADQLSIDEQLFELAS